jgi:hypothetical protein
MVRSREWLAVFAAFALLNLIYATAQPTLSFNGGRGDDAARYFAMAAQARDGARMTAIQPFAHRPGTPLLAAAVSVASGWEIEAAFKRVNIAANLVTVVLLRMFLQRHVAGTFARLFVLTFFMIEPHSPVRLVYAYPVYVDPIALTALVAGLLAIDRFTSHPSRANAALLTIIVGMGAAFRETTIVIGVALLANGTNWRRASAWLPVIAGIIALAVVDSLVAATGSGYSMAAEAWRFARDKSLLTYMLAWLMVFGPMLAAPFFYWHRSAHLLTKNRALLIYMMAFAILAWIGGTDTERLLVFASPVIYLLVANAIGWSRIAPLSLATACLVLMQAASARGFASIRGPGELLTAVERSAAYQNLWTEFSPPRLLMIYWLGYGLMTIVVMAWLQRRRDSAR